MRSHSRSGSRAESQEGHSPWPDPVRPSPPHHPLVRVVIA
jgi:hypothetical protein